MPQSIIINNFDTAIRRLLQLLDTPLPDDALCPDAQCIERECRWFNEMAYLELQQLLERTQVLILSRAETPFTLETAEFGKDKIIIIRNKLKSSLHKFNPDSLAIANDLNHNMMQLVNLELTDQQRKTKWKALKDKAKSEFASSSLIPSILEDDLKAQFDTNKITDDQLRDFALRNACDKTEIMRFMCRHLKIWQDKSDNDSTPTFKYKWIDEHAYRIDETYAKFIQWNWIPKETKKMDFRLLFYGYDVKTQVMWLGPLGALYYFVITLVKREIITAQTKNGHWKVVSNHFIGKNGQPIDNLHDQHAPENVDDLDDTIDNLDIGRILNARKT